MYALVYLVMFAIPLLAAGEKPSWIVRLAALSGFAMTSLYATLSAFPTIAVANPLAFNFKIAATVTGINLAGWFYFSQRRKQMRRSAAEPGPRLA